MHMISKKDLNSAELETVTTSRSPMTVITANGKVQTHEEATVYVKEFDIFLTMKVLENTPAVLSLGKLCDETRYSFEWINGQKPHLIKNGIRIQCNTENFVLIVVPGFVNEFSLKLPYFTIHDTFQGRKLIIPSLPHSLSTSTLMTSSRRLIIQITLQQSCQAKVWKGKNGGDPYSSETSEELLKRPTKNPKLNKNENHEKVRGDPCSDIPECLQEFREILLDERVPDHRDSHASSSHEPSLQPMGSVDLGKHSVFTHFPKDRNCEVCQRGPKITRAP